MKRREPPVVFISLKCYLEHNHGYPRRPRHETEMVRVNTRAIDCIKHNKGGSEVHLRGELLYCQSHPDAIMKMIGKAYKKMLRS